MKQKAVIKFLATLDITIIETIHKNYCEHNKIEVSNKIDYNKLADFLIDWGDSDYQFDMTQHLSDSFKKYAYILLSEKYSWDEVSKIVDESYADFLMDDWLDILNEDFEDFIGICPNCNNAIFSDSEHEYIYETGRTKYSCEHCNSSLFV